MNRLAIITVVCFCPLIAFGAGIVGPFFAPGPDPEQAWVNEINAAKDSYYFKAYGFDSQPVVDALIAAQKRGVDVQGCVDKSNAAQSYSLVPQLVKAGISILVDYTPPIAHSKYGIRDGHSVITGSYNPTNQARRNSENVIVIDDKKTAAAYLADFKDRQSRSESWQVAIGKASKTNKRKHP